MFLFNNVFVHCQLIVQKCMLLLPSNTLSFSVLYMLYSKLGWDSGVFILATACTFVFNMEI